MAPVPHQSRLSRRQPCVLVGSQGQPMSFSVLHQGPVYRSPSLEVAGSWVLTAPVGRGCLWSYPAASGVFCFFILFLAMQFVTMWLKEGQKIMECVSASVAFRQTLHTHKQLTAFLKRCVVALFVCGGILVGTRGKGQDLLSSGVTAHCELREASHWRKTANSAALTTNQSMGAWRSRQMCG